MNRRDVLKFGAGAGLIILPAIGCAQGTPAPAPQPATLASDTITLTSTIGRNHGHVVPLDATAVLKLLRQTKQSGPVSLSIQGSAGHSHDLQLTHDEILALIESGTLAKDSTVGAAHSHPITLAFELK